MHKGWGTSLLYGEAQRHRLQPINDIVQIVKTWSNFWTVLFTSHLHDMYISWGTARRLILCDRVPKRDRRTSSRSRLIWESASTLPHSEHLCPANGTCPLGRRLTIFHRYWLWILHLPFRPALHAVCLHWLPSCFRLGQAFSFGLLAIQLLRCFCFPALSSNKRNDC